MTLKCSKCRHYYVRMVGKDGTGYNPAPCCWLYEDTGKRPNILTQECYEKTVVNKKTRRGHRVEV